MSMRLWFDIFIYRSIMSERETLNLVSELSFLCTYNGS